MQAFATSAVSGSVSILESVVTVTISETTDIGLDPGTLPIGTFAQRKALEGSLEEAACTAMVGQCSVTLLGWQQRRVLTDDLAARERALAMYEVMPPPSAPPPPRSVQLTLYRVYDYEASSASSESATTLIQSGLASRSVVVTASTLTKLQGSAFVHVNSADVDAASLSLAAAMDPAFAEGALHSQLPNTEFTIQMPVVVLPPRPPPPAQPSPPPAMPSPPNAPPLLPLTEAASMNGPVFTMVSVFLLFAAAAFAGIGVCWTCIFVYARRRFGKGQTAKTVAASFASVDLSVDSLGKLVSVDLGTSCKGTAVLPQAHRPAPKVTYSQVMTPAEQNASSCLSAAAVAAAAERRRARGEDSGAPRALGESVASVGASGRRVLANRSRAADQTSELARLRVEAVARAREQFEAQKQDSQATFPGIRSSTAASITLEGAASPGAASPGATVARRLALDDNDRNLDLEDNPQSRASPSLILRGKQAPPLRYDEDHRITAPRGLIPSPSADLRGWQNSITAPRGPPPPPRQHQQPGTQGAARPAPSLPAGENAYSNMRTVRALPRAPSSGVGRGVQEQQQGVLINGYKERKAKQLQASPFGK